MSVIRATRPVGMPADGGPRTLRLRGAKAFLAVPDAAARGRAPGLRRDPDGLGALRRIRHGRHAAPDELGSGSPRGPGVRPRDRVPRIPALRVSYAPRRKGRPPVRGVGPPRRRARAAPLV